MKEWQDRQQWQDPTAERAIRLANRGRHGRQRYHFAPNRLTERAIPNADYRARIDPSGGLHASLEQNVERRR